LYTITYKLSLVFIFFIPWEGVIDLPGLGSGTKIIGFALTAFWVVTIVIEGRFRKPRPFYVVLCLFVIWNAISVFWSGDLDRTITHVVTWIQLLGLVLILWDLYTTRAALFAGLQAYILGAYIAISIAIFNYFSGNVYYTHYQRFSPAAETNPDGFAFIIALGIPVAWYLASSTNTTKMRFMLKFVNYVYIPAAFVGIALSGTRTALIATLPGMAFGLASFTRLRPWARISIFVLLTAAVIISLPYVKTLRSFQRFSTIGTEIAEGNLNQRTDLWREGLTAFVEHPIRGVGSNMYRSVNSLGFYFGPGRTWIDRIHSIWNFAGDCCDSGMGPAKMGLMVLAYCSFGLDHWCFQPYI
jgi:O-antigen ligase